MRLLDSLRRRRRGRHAASTSSEPLSAGDQQQPIADYDRLRADRVTEDLHRHSQTELAGIETYERSHQDRPEVLDKLRYLRGNEPLPEYDALDVNQISAALESADLETLRLVREYEMKFHRREDVLDELARIRRQRKTSSNA
jgi:hypothetical protein